MVRNCKLRLEENMDDKLITLSEFLYKCIAYNDLIYCNTLDEDGGFMMRGNEWNTDTAKQYYITRVFVNSAKAIQCRLCKVD
jgi:hypothetical protein